MADINDKPTQEERFIAFPSVENRRIKPPVSERKLLIYSGAIIIINTLITLLLIFLLTGNIRLKAMPASNAYPAGKDSQTPIQIESVVPTLTSTPTISMTSTITPIPTNTPYPIPACSYLLHDRFFLEGDKFLSNRYAYFPRDTCIHLAFTQTPIRVIDNKTKDEYAEVAVWLWVANETINGDKLIFSDNLKKSYFDAPGMGSPSEYYDYIEGASIYINEPGNEYSQIIIVGWLEKKEISSIPPTPTPTSSSTPSK
jgi:hypothetical protein